jgi:hypothetical protein
VRGGPMAEISNELAWRRSKWCGTSACVEVASLDDTLLVRDSKDPHGSQLSFIAADWAAFVTELRDGGLAQPSV